LNVLNVIIGVLILQYNLLWVFIEHFFCGGQPKKEWQHALVLTLQVSANNIKPRLYNFFYNSKEANSISNFDFTRLTKQANNHEL